MANQDNTPDNSVSRRDFLLRAGQVGALSVIAPTFARDLIPAGDTGHALYPADPYLTPAGDAAARRFASTSLGLRWRHLGPFRGGRIAAVSGVPGRVNEFYYGSVNGGVWKSIDAGRVWSPVFDDQPVASIGALAVAPSAPDVVYVGTGESTLRDNMGYGNGVYKSTNAGKTWTHLGLDGTQHIGRVAVHPHNPQIVFVAAIGPMYAPSPDRGLFRSTNGGATWTKVLFKNNDVGAVDVVIDPTNPQVVYASMWNTRRPPWYTYQPSNGPGGGLFKSIDGGTTWKQMTNGLPKEGIGRSGVVVCPSNPRRLYAVIDDLLNEGESPAPIGNGVGTPAPAGGGGGGAGRAGGGGAGRAGGGGAGRAGGGAGGGAAASTPQKQGGFYRSDDAGATWHKVSGDNELWGRGWYFEKLAVDPKNADIVYVPNVAVARTKDGGKTWVALRGSPGGDDYHQAWISPDDSNTMIVASDQGAIITRNAKSEDPRDVTWSSWLNQATAQIYHVSVDYRFPYWVTGAQQDSGSVAVRSRGKFGEISTRDWEPIGAGGESGYTAGDPLHPGIIYGGTGSRFDLELNASVPGTTAPRGTEPNRKDWTQPLVFSKADRKALYYGSQFLFKTTDGAATWNQISPDLTRPDPGIPATLDAAAAVDTDPTNGRRGVIYTIAPSPVNAPMVWVGTDDGFIQMTTDDGKSWNNVTPPELSSWSRITTVEASHFDANTAYASVSRHQLQDFEPYIYRTRDMGRTWKKITNGLPSGVYVHVVKEDPMRKGLLFAGTERSLFMSLDDGDTWQSLQLNMPVTSMRDFEIYNNDLILATHGRGFWVIDDISPLRQISADVLAADAYLFKPADAYNYVQGGDNGTPMQKDEPQAENPPNGAAIDYFLKSDAAATSPVTLEILDANGTVVRTFSSNATSGAGNGGGFGGGGGRGGAGGGIPNTSPLWRTPPEPFQATAGMHRVNFAPAGGGGRGGGGRGGAGGGAPAQQTGNFTARLTANGKTYTQTFAIMADPRLANRGV